MTDSTNNLNCVHCNSELTLIATDVLSDWAGQNILVCFNNQCPFYLNSEKTMLKQGVSLRYRYRYNPDNGDEGALLVLDECSYKDRIIDWEEIICPKEEKTTLDEVVFKDDILDYLAKLDRKIDQILMMFKNNPSLINK